MPNYSKMARNALILYVVFHIIASISFFITGFAIIANYIPFHLKCMITVPAALVGLGTAIFAGIQDRKYNDYKYKAKWG